MRNKKFLSGGYGLAFIILFALGGCQSLGSSMGGLVTPKKKVQPLEDTEKAKGDASREKDIASASPGQGPSPAVVAPPAVPAIPEGSMVVDADVFSSMAGYVSGRKGLYRDLLSRWQGVATDFSRRDLAVPQPEKWQECLGMLEIIVDEYTVLNSMLKNSGKDQSGRQSSSSPSFAVFQKDISFLESNCRAIFTATDAIISGEPDATRKDFSGQAEEVIRYWAKQQDYAKVVDAYENFVTERTAGSALPPETLELYAYALKHEGKMIKGAEVLLEAAEAKGEALGWPLRLQAAELLFAEGEFVRARSEYDSLLHLFSGMKPALSEVEKQLALLGGQEDHGQELELYRMALKGWLQGEGRELTPDLVDSVRILEENFPQSDYARMARELIAKVSGGEAQDDGDDPVGRARRLAADKQFVQALELLAPLLAQEPHSQEIDAMAAEFTAELEKQQTGEAEAAQAMKEALAKKWQEAMQVLDHRQFDQAIVLFAELEDSEEYRDQARVKISEAMNLAAAELRKEAANLFVKSRKTENVEQKTALLLESRKLLLQVQQKYPRAEIIDKVKQNLKAIEDQMRAINPDLLTNPEHVALP